METSSRILVADDNPAGLELLCAILEAEGHDVVAVRDGREALEAVERTAIDLALLDWRMPHFDGAEVTRRLKADPRTERVPVVVLTAHLSSELALTCLESGAEEFVTKPFVRTELLCRIRNLLRLKHLSDALEAERANLEERVRARTAELERANLGLEAWRRRCSAIVDATGLVLYDWCVDTGDVTYSGDLDGLLGLAASGVGQRRADWLSKLAPEDRVRLVDAAGGAVREGTPVSLDYGFRRADGTYVVLHDDGRVVRDADGQVRLLGFVHDVTHQRRLEQQAATASRLESVGQLAAGVSHDFNNLLGVVDMMTTSLLQGDALAASPDAREDVELIREAAQRGARLTQQLLEFRRGGESDPHEVDLASVVGRMEKLLRGVAGRGPALAFELGAEPLQVVGDEGQLEQVLLNLVSNARDALPTGGGRIEVRVDPDAAPGNVAGDRWVLLQVADDGCGMTPEVRARALDPFFTSKPAGKGTGLGLSTVYGIVRGLGGHLEIESKEGDGTRVRIWLRAAVSQERVEQATPASRGTIFVVDDDPAVVKVVTRMLRQDGHTVIASTAAGDALVLAAQYEGQIDLLLTDVVMPTLSGIELARRIQSRRQETHALFMSGQLADSLGEYGLDPSAHLLIGKPFRWPELRGCVDRALGR